MPTRRFKDRNCANVPEIGCNYSSAMAGKFARGPFYLGLKEKNEANTRCGQPRRKESSTR